MSRGRNEHEKSMAMVKKNKTHIEKVISLVTDGVSISLYDFVFMSDLFTIKQTNSKDENHDYI